MTDKMLDQDNVAVVDAAVKEAQRRYAEGKLFGIVEDALETQAQLILDQLGAMGIDPQLGFEMLHAATTALDAALTKTAQASMGARVEQIKSHRSAAWALGLQLHEKAWLPRLDLGVPSWKLRKPEQVGIVGVNGLPLALAMPKIPS